MGEDVRCGGDHGECILGALSHGNHQSETNHTGQVGCHVMRTARYSTIIRFSIAIVIVLLLVVWRVVILVLWRGKVVDENELRVPKIAELRPKSTVHASDIAQIDIEVVSFANRVRWPRGGTAIVGVPSVGELEQVLLDFRNEVALCIVEEDTRVAGLSRVETIR